MIVVIPDRLQKRFRKLPENIRKKAKKQFLFLALDLRHPSIRAKKIEGFDDVWEGRVDRFYRFTFSIEEDTISILSIGPHDEGLGKK